MRTTKKIKKNLTKQKIDSLLKSFNRYIESKKKKIYQIPFNSIRQYLVVDTEGKGDVTKGQNPFLYELGIVRYDNILHEIKDAISYLNLTVFNNEEDMDNAFFGKTKRDIYELFINPRNRYEKNLKPLYEKYKHNFYSNDRNQILSFFNIEMSPKDEFIFAYNAYYDCQSILNTYKLSPVNSRKFKDKDVVCIMVQFLLMLQNIPEEREKYINFCIKHNYITDKGNAQYKVEIIIRYILNDVEYREEHIGLFDAIDENTILLWINSVYTRYGKVFYVEVNNLTKIGIRRDLMKAY